jgi:hypothetical protein
MSKKIGATVSEEFYNRFTAYAKRLGLNYSQFGGLCLQAGMGAMVRAIFPEETLTEKNFVDILKAGKDLGLEIDLDKVLKELQDVKKSG